MQHQHRGSLRPSQQLKNHLQHGQSETEAGFQRMPPRSQHQHDPVQVCPPALAIAGLMSPPDSLTQHREHER